MQKKKSIFFLKYCIRNLKFYEESQEILSKKLEVVNNELVEYKAIDKKLEEERIKNNQVILSRIIIF